jgi:hypothetical protein
MGHEAVVAQNRTPGDAAIGAHRRKVAQPLRCTDFNEDYCKQSGGKGGPYCGLRGLREAAGWASGDGVLPHHQSTGEGAPLRSFDGYEELNGIYILLWCLLTQGTGLKGGRTMRRCVSLSSEVAAGEKWLGRCSTGPFIGARVLVSPKPPSEAYPQGNQRSFR